jgi:hypothetical protein
MTRPLEHTPVLARALGWSCLLWLGCSAPDLGHTLFSCATDADCAPEQACLQYLDGFACQRPRASDSQCPGGICTGSEPATTNAPLQSAPPAVAPPPDSACREGSCSPSSVSLSPAQHEPDQPAAGAALADAGTPPNLLDASADAAAVTPAPAPPDDESDEPDATVPEEPAPPIRHDFELSLEGWQSVAAQRPEDTLDGTEQTTELAHHGSGALRMVYDGNYTPEPGVTPGNSFYGAYVDGAPPPGVTVSLWMLSTAPDVSVELYSQPDPPLTTTTLATVPLLENEWREIRVIMPLVQAQLFGVQVHSELDLEGSVYLDEVRW